MPNFDRLVRSRLKVTLLICGVLLLLSIFPMWFIYYAAIHREFHAVAAWSAWGISVTAIGTLAGYFVKKDTDRPSFVNNTVSNIHVPEVKHLPSEEDDPEYMPI